MVHNRVEHAQVRLSGVTGTGGDKLEVVGIGRHSIVIRLHVQGKLFLGLQVPVHREDGGQGGDRWAGDFHHVVNPRAVLGLVLTLDHVHRAEETRVTINDHDLAVVAQIGAAETALV